MSLENLYSDNEKKEKEKKSLNAREKFLEEQKILRESSELLQSLALKISREFWIDISEVKEFIKWDTLWDLAWLKNTLWENIDSYEFQKAIEKARNSISNLSREHRENLKKSLEWDLDNPENYSYALTEKYFSKYKYRVLHPEGFSDHALWVWLGILDTTEAVILFVYGLGKWILFTPYHLYLIVSWKAEFNIWKKI